MLRSYDINKITLFALSSHRELILSKVQELGLMQPVELKQADIKELKKPSDIANIREISDNLLRVSRIHSILKLVPKKPSFIQGILGLEFLDKRKTDRKTPGQILKESGAFLGKYENKLVSLEEEYKTLGEREEDLLEYKEIAEVLDNLDIPVAMLGNTERLCIITGKISNENLVSLKDELNKELNGFLHLITRKKDKKESVIVAASLIEKHSDVIFLLKKYNAGVITIPHWGKWELPAVHTKVELKKIETKKDSIIRDISKYGNEIFEDTVVLREELEILKQRYETLHSMLDSEKFFAFRGWILKRDAERFQQELSNLTNGRIYFEIEEPMPGEDAPVELSNSKYFKPFEYLTELYALPKYKDLDPTFIIGPVFIVFAAFMLTDAVYGLFLVILGIFLLKKLARYDKAIKDAAISVLGIGLLTILFGILTGSYFGDFPKYIWGIEPEQIALWKDPLADPLYFLIIAIGVAVVYLNIGFVLGLIEDYRKGDYRAMFKERIVWFILQIGVALIALKINPLLFSIYGMNIGLAALIIIISVLSIVFTHGPLGLLGITGLMGDMISFSRLFALSLSTAGIALAVNLLANLVVGFPYVGIILAVIIFFVGQMFGFVMNSIGSFVHSLRLQFVEFFGRFYEGGGDRFQPLKEERYYTEVKNE